jgi:FkbM family methyltransferase
MKQLIVKLILFFIPKKIKDIILFNQKYGQISYSQAGEDLLIQAILQKKKGFYVDIGAHHPQRFSNTNLFYLQGWNGINIDPMPKSMELFNAERPRDINLEIAISEDDTEKDYYIYEEKAFNTMDKKVNKSLSQRMIEPIEKVKIKCERLESILDMHLEKDSKIDFLSIDVEGLEMKALGSNNWHKYRPTLIVLENNQRSVDKIRDDIINIYLEEFGYSLMTFTPLNKFYLNIEA